MSRERAALLEQLFHGAVDLPGDRREAYFAAQTVEASLLAEVRALLAEHDRGTTGVLASNAGAIAADPEHAAAAGDGWTDDRYRLVRVLGEGGLGVVWLAEQTRPLHRNVAIKFVKLGMDSAQVLARFEAERQALALMDHAGIARVFDAGLTRDGRPYFVMEHVPGSPLCAFADAERLTTRGRLELFAQVCDAVHHAHRKGIVHRDLKPSNILVSRVDEAPVAKIIDFGIAKATLAPLVDRPFATIEGQVIGTPAYMSPEQSRGEHVDSTTDVYSLGVTLYELLTGALPFDPVRPDAQGSSGSGARPGRTPDAAVRPSSRIAALGDSGIARAALRRTEPRQLARSLRGDLDWIVLKAVEPERERRYASASELAADIRHHMEGEPVRAGPPGLRREVARLVRRHRTFVAVLAAIFVALAVGIAVAVAAARREGELRERAERDRYRLNIVAATAALASGNASLARRALDDAAARYRGWEWRFLQWKSDRSLWTLRFESRADARLAECCDGTRLVGIDGKGRIAVRDAASGETLSTCDTGLIEATAIPSPDGKLALLTGLDALGEPMYAAWDLDARAELWRRPGRAAVVPLSFARDGSEAVLLAGDWSRLVFLEPRSGVELRSIALDASRRPYFLGLADGLAIVTDEAGARGIDGVTGATAWRRDERSLTFGALDSGRRYVLFPGLLQQRGRILDAASGAQLDAPTRLDELYDAHPREGGGTIALQSSGMELVLVDTATDQELVRLPGPAGTAVLDARFFGDGSRIGSVSNALEFKLWSAEISPLPFRAGRKGYPRDVHAATGRSAFSAWGLLQVWDAIAGTVAWSRMLTRGGEVPAAAFSPAGDALAVDPGRGPLLRLDGADGTVRAQLADPPGDATCLEWLRDGSAVLAGGADGAVSVCDSSRPSILRTLPCHATAVRALAVSDDGRLLATGSDAGPPPSSASRGSEVKVFDIATGELILELGPRADRARASAVICLAFDPGATRLAIGSQDGSCEVFDLDARQVAISLRGEHPVTAVRFMGPERLAIGYPGARVHVYDAATGGFLLELEAWGEAIDFDGERLVSCGLDGPACAAEVRAPASGDHARAIAARARAIVDALPRTSLIASDVVATLEDLDLPPDVAQAARLYAQRRGENANELNSEAWNVARTPGPPEADLLLARRLAERADAISPDDWGILNTIATLELRLGRVEDAIAAAERSNALLVRSGREPHPMNFLVLAMARWRGGQHEAARTDLATARRMASAEPHASDRDTIAVLQEALALVPP